MKLAHSFLPVLVIAAHAADLLFADHLVGYYSEEIQAAKALGYVSELVTIPEWKAMKTQDFARYKAIIINDPYSGGSASDLDFLEETADIWGPVVQGNIIIHGM